MVISFPASRRLSDPRRRLPKSRRRLPVSFAALLLAATGLPLLVGCGGGSPPDGASRSAEANKSTTPEAVATADTPLTPPVLVDVAGDDASPDETADVVGETATQSTNASAIRPASAKLASGSADSTAERSESAEAGTDAEAAETAASGRSEPQAGPEEDAYMDWPEPALALFVTGQQHGYFEPCGCTGLERQKGGLARRHTFLKQLRSRGWDVLPLDAGNQVRRFGRQAEIKYHRTVEALRIMDYGAVGFGPDDLRLSVGDLIQEAAAESPSEALYTSANVVLIDPSLMPQFKVIERGGVKVGITSVLDPESLGGSPGDEVSIQPPVSAAKEALEAINGQSPDYRVLMMYGSEESARSLAKEVPGFDLLVAAGGYGEPTYQPESIEGTETQMILTGNKGMHVGLVGLYPEGPIRYARVALTHAFGDSPEMRQLMAEYQDQLRDVGLEGLGLRPVPHPSGHSFVGTETCGECHTIAHDIWAGTPHALATAHIVEPREERGDVPRHFDPECLSCHVTGWNPQEYYPYETGYLSLEKSDHLTGNGCENCHGPGSAHVAAESGGSGVTDERRDELRLEMRLPLEEARQRCLECHDLDNSPDFHEEYAFEDEYWPEVEHYGVD
jgi:hypothetical protein